MNAYKSQKLWVSLESTHHFESTHCRSLHGIQISLKKINNNNNEMQSFKLLFEHNTICSSYRIRQIPFFFWKILLKKNYKIFSQISFFYLKVQSFRLRMENNFIQMAASLILWFLKMLTKGESKSITACTLLIMSMISTSNFEYD